MPSYLDYEIKGPYLKYGAVNDKRRNKKSKDTYMDVYAFALAIFISNQLHVLLKPWPSIPRPVFYSVLAQF